MAADKPRAAGNNNFHDELEMRGVSVTPNHTVSHVATGAIWKRRQTFMSF